MNWNWKLTVAKSVIVGALAALGVSYADIANLQGWWVALAVVSLETVRDLIKARWGNLIPKTGQPTDMASLTRTRRGKYGLSFSGMETLSRALARDGGVWQRVQQAAVRGMIENSEDLLGRAMRDAPVDEGTLRASGTAAVYANGRAVARRGFREIGDRPTVDPDRYVMQTRHAVQEGGVGDAIIGEVGFNTPYALTQHERIDFQHPKGGKAKYLEQPLKEQASRYQENLESHLREAIS